MKESDLLELGFEYFGRPHIEQGKLTASIVREGHRFQYLPQPHYDLHHPDPEYLFDANSGCVTATALPSPDAIGRLLRTLRFISTPTPEQMESQMRLIAEALVHQLVLRIEQQQATNVEEAELSRRLTEAAFPSDA